MSEEIVRHLFERVLILAPGGVDELDKAVLVELRAMREHVVRKRYPDRPSGIACCIDQGRGKVSFAGRKPFGR